MKIHIYLKQTSHNNPNNRPYWFSYEKCFKNLLDTIDFNICDLTVIFDGELKNHFTEKYIGKYNFKVHKIDSRKIDSNSENAWSSSAKLVCKKIDEDKLNEDDIIYMVDNDYLHLPMWSQIVYDLFNADIKHSILVSLYDHFDKYLFTYPDRMNEWGMYKNLTSKIIISHFCHWRTVPSICMSWLMSVNTFNNNKDVFHAGLADNTGSDIMFKKGYHILSPIPSLATHCQEPFLAPIINWEKYNNSIII